MMKKLFTILLVFAVCLGLSACGTNGVKSLTFSATSCEVVVDETYQVIYSIFPEDANTEELHWKSIDESIATVSITGLITAKSVGTTSITVDNGEDILASCSVTVRQKPAYQRLSENEKKFVNAFLREIDNFKNPDSVIIQGISFIEADEDSTIGDFWSIELKAENGFGAMDTGYYYLTSTGLMENEYGSILSHWYNSEYNVDLINEAIAEKR